MGRYALAEERLADGRFVSARLLLQNEDTWNQLDRQLDEALGEIASLPEAQ